MDEVSQWERVFRAAHPALRVDMLNAVLYACTAHELRFAAAVVEDLASAEASSLHRDADLANSITGRFQNVLLDCCFQMS